MPNQFKKIILLGGDIFILYCSLYLTLLIRYLEKPSLSVWQIHLGPFTVMFIFWIIIFYILNLYNLNYAANNKNFFKTAARGLMIAGGMAIAFFYLTPQIAISPKRNLLIYLIIFLILFYLWRIFYNWSLKSYLPKNNIAIIGVNDQVKELVSELKSKPHLGFNVLLLINNQSDYKFNNIPVYSPNDDLKKLFKQYKINTVVATTDINQSSELRRKLFESLFLKITFINLPDFYENITGKIPINIINQTWFLENLSEGNKKIFDIFKRSYDILISLLILMATIIFWPIIALIIKLESRGPVFIKMKRIGKNNKEFKMYKFRTMKEEGNQRTITIKNDPRITRFGKIMRKLRIDELPQIINIIKGEMSFVGPRPERPELTEKLEKMVPFFSERTLVKPGITGWDQISGEYHSPTYEDTLKKIQYDLFYIKNRSIYLDLSIILKTIYTIISREGR